MGAGVSTTSDDTTSTGFNRSTMIISHTAYSHQPPPPFQLRRQSNIAGSNTSGISSQIVVPLSFYPNNVYQPQPIFVENSSPIIHNSSLHDHPPPYTATAPPLNR